MKEYVGEIIDGLVVGIAIWVTGNPHWLWFLLLLRITRCV